MPKGKPWTVNEERLLRELRIDGKTVAEIALRMNKTPDAVKKKLGRLGLKVVVSDKKFGGTTNELIMPREMPSIEESLLKQAAAMNALEKPGLSKTEVSRLKAIVSSCIAYQKRLAEYIDYRGIEKDLVELSVKYEALLKDEQGKAVKPRVARLTARRGVADDYGEAVKEVKT